MLVVNAMAGGYRYLEHSSDIYVEAWGESLEEAFEKAAEAMFNAMTDLGKVEAERGVEVEAEGGDEQELLYSWLENLLVKYEVEGLVFSRFKVESLEKTGEGLKLKGKAFGEPLNLEKHPSKVEIKAVTYHLMEVKREDSRFLVRVLFDI
ncbi:archease [Candidatus Bathyarchaeota archaeon]|nr:MAG: archease [Candidatus Bathyarchaeota archaeon]